MVGRLLISTTLCFCIGSSYGVGPGLRTPDLPGLQTPDCSGIKTRTGPTDRFEQPYQSGVWSPESGAGFCSPSDFSSIPCSNRPKRSRLQPPDCSRIKTRTGPTDRFEQPYQSGVRSPESGAGFCSPSDFSSIQCSNRLKRSRLQTPGCSRIKTRTGPTDRFEQPYQSGVRSAMGISPSATTGSRAMARNGTKAGCARR